MQTETHARSHARPHARRHAHGAPPVPLPGILFFEDFDAAELPLPPEPAEPPPLPPPPLTQADLEAACAAAWEEGHAVGLTQARTESAAVTGRALEAMASALAGAVEVVGAAAEARATTITRALLSCLGGVMPKLSARYGAEEIAAIAHKIERALLYEPAVSFRVNPRSRAAVAEALHVLDPELRERLRFVETEAVAEGDVRIEWKNGAAVRNAATLWQAVLDVLTREELIDPPPTESIVSAATAVRRLEAPARSTEREAAEVSDRKAALIEPAHALATG